VEDITSRTIQFSRAPFVNAKSLKVAVELKPLIFSKSLRISGITLENPSITLIRSADGTWNFSDLGSGQAGPKTPKAAQSAASPERTSRSEQLEIGGRPNHNYSRGGSPEAFHL